MGVKLRIAALLCWILAAPVVNAQEQRVIDGRKYTVHVVETGQTLYAIARANAVPVDVLLAANPSAHDGLSIGEEVLIPVAAVVKKELKTAPMLRHGELVHVVRKKETLFGIARQYGVDINQLLERNPNGLSLQEGMELAIPVAQVAGAPASALVPATPGRGITHVVQPGETLFGLGRRYAVDPEEIKRINGGLPEGLKAGLAINIPGTGGDEEPVKPVVRIREHMRYKVGMLLPFSISRNDSVMGLPATDGAYYEPTRLAVQFHQGALLAIDSLRNMGLHAEIDVLDVGDEARVWNGVFKGADIQGYDLFIGPFNRSAIEQLARTTPRTPIVCPVQQSNRVILGMPMVSKVMPTRSDLVKHAARYVVSRHAADHVILLRPDIAAEKDLQEQMRAALEDAFQRNGRSDSVRVARPGKRDLGDLPTRLDAARLNVIVAPCEDVESVTTLVSKLKSLATKYRIRVVGLESWYTMPTVAPADLDVLDFVHAAPAFFDPADLRTQAFIAAYRERFKSDVDEYALLGFDVTFFYLKALLTQGTAFTDHLAEVRTEPLYMGFRMSRTGAENGFRNEYGIMLQQKDLQLMKAP